MDNRFLVYLSGPITGLTYGDCTDWREFATQSFPPHIQAITPMRGHRILEGVGKIGNPDTANEEAYKHPLLGSRAINTRDHFDVLRADALLVNLLGTERVSISTVAEMAWAFDHKKPIICAIEPSLNIHEHPMLSQWIDFRASSLREAIELTVAVLAPHDRYIWDNTELMEMARSVNKLDTSSDSLKQVM